MKMYAIAAPSFATGYLAWRLNVASMADTLIKTVVAALTLIAAPMVLIGLARGWLGRRRAQVVIEDIAAAEGIAPSATSGLSPQLRQAVRQALEKESGDASYSVLSTLDRDIESGLLRPHGRVQIKTIAAELRSSTEDSLTTLAAGVRAVAPTEADGLVAALGAAMPSQRGWVVHAYPVLRGEGTAAEVGLTLELAQIGRPPDAVTTFWESSQMLRSAATDAVTAAAMRALLHRLLEPAALWIGIRLVARQLAQSGVPMRWRLLSGRKMRAELTGLQMQLAGQMSLYAATEQEQFARGFAGQALADLALAARLLPGYFRPHSAQAAVHERLGWSYRRSRDPGRAADEFARAVQGYDQAAQALAAAVRADPGARDAAVERVTVRRAKCRLLTRDRGHAGVAQQELAGLCQLTACSALDLYNAACLFAVAMDYPHLPDGRSRYTWYAWHLLGRALLAEGANGPWGDMMTDADLTALGERQRRDFCAALTALHPSLTPLAGQSAELVVKEAMHTLGVGAPKDP